jgi:hypothetical protein
MNRKHILDRDPEDYRPMYYWVKNKGGVRPDPPTFPDALPKRRTEADRVRDDEIRYLVRLRQSITKRIEFLGGIDRLTD